MESMLLDYDQTPFSMRNQRVLIVGASSGIGEATAKLVSALGGHPILASRSAGKLKSVQGNLADPENSSILAFDYLDAEAVKASLAGVESIDHVMISAVADENKKRGSFAGLDRATMDASFDKFWGQVNVLQAALPKLRKDGSATMFASIAGIKPAGKSSGLSVMNAVQAGVIQLARSLAVELTPLRVNVVAPGVVLTDVWSEKERDELEQWMKTSLPAQRAGEPVHIAQAVIAMMTNPYQTGVVLPVDGGLLLT